MYPGFWGTRAADKPAIIDTGSGKTVTHGALNENSNRLAHLLRRRGLKRGSRIAILMENNNRFFECVWAGIRSGLYVTPINRHLKAEEAAYIIRDSQAEAVISSFYLAPVARELPSLAPGCSLWLMVDGAIAGYESYESALMDCPRNNLAEEPIGMFLYYSSGTTGRPKGVLRPLFEGISAAETAKHMAWLHQHLWAWNEQTVYLSTGPLYHTAPCGFTLATVACGGTVVTMPRFDPIEALRAIEQYRVTHSQWVPTMFVRLLKLPEQERTRWDLGSLKVVLHAAAPCPEGIKCQMIEWLGPIVYELFGGTETNGMTHITSPEWLAHPGSVGRPIYGTPHICDGAGAELPPGKVGHVYFELECMPFEYLGDQAKTSEARHPTHPNWSCIGDMGYLDEEGYLYLTDRASFMIVSGGVNIYPQEVENALTMHPAVADVAVIGVPNEEMGEEVKAVVQLGPGFTPSERLTAELIEYCRSQLAHYKCPRTVDFVDQLPRMPTGKLHKGLLKDKYWGGRQSRIV